MGGKIDNIYDMFDEIKQTYFPITSDGAP
jgi:hypothetical protein